MAAKRTHTELKRATRDLVRKVGGLKVAAASLDRSPSQVQRYTDIKYPDDIGVSQILTLERAVSDLIVTGMLAHLQGSAVITLTHHAAKANGIHSRYARAMKATVELSAGFAEAATRNPNISQHDILQLARQTHEALSRFSDLLSALHAKGAA